MAVIRGKFSREILTHYQCGACRRWWSIGDSPARRRRWFCPWCGTGQIMDPKATPEDVDETAAPECRTS